MKGHIKIELNDVVTGKREVHEQDNMMTNAIAKMIAFTSGHAMGTNPLDTYTSHWYHLMGGVALFDTAFDNNPDHFYVPAGTTMIGCGGVEDANSYNNVTPWGIYNAQESDLSQTDTKKMVWDFSTNHANGTIASIGLTHRICGRRLGFGHSSWFGLDNSEAGRIAVGEAMRQSKKSGLGETYYMSYGTVGTQLSLNDGTYVDFCIDTENDEKYMLKVCLDGISIVKHKMQPEVFDIFRSSTNYQSYDEETYSESFSDYGSYFYCFYNTDEKNLYFWASNSTSNSVNSFDAYIHKYDMTAKTLTKNWNRVTLPAVTNVNYYPSFIITNNSVYYLIWDRRTTTTYRLQKRYFTSGNVDTINFTNAQELGFIGRNAYILSGKIYFQCASRLTTTGSNYATVIYDTVSNSVFYTYLYTPRGSYNIASSTTRYIVTVPPIDNTQIVFGTMMPANYSDGSSPIGLVNTSGFRDYQFSDSQKFVNNRQNMWSPTHYLATKSNLAEPVIKTAQQTMKLTYTITKEEE